MIGVKIKGIVLLTEGVFCVESQETRKLKLETSKDKKSLKVSEKTHSQLLSLKIVLGKESNDEVIQYLLSRALINLSAEDLKDYGLLAESRGVRNPLDAKMRRKVNREG